MKTTRRRFLRTCSALGAAVLGSPSFCTPSFGQAAPTVKRTFHSTVSSKAIEADPELLPAMAQAGVGDVWFTGFWAGNWIESPQKVRTMRETVEKHGMGCHVINVPLGHPDCGNPAWKKAQRIDGSTYTGVSLHPPATKENCRAMREIQAAGIDRAFVDDDFRVATGPGVIGGCFCPEHKRQFMERAGLRNDGQWTDLLDAVKQRRFTPTLRAWVDWQCDQLTACFRAQREAAPNVRLGVMVMYLGAEKAGIRLTDYDDVPFRVGEFMFGDAAFNPVKGKTDELFSSLFHRRFVKPESAFSETTAYPNNTLSLSNKIAKLAVSTISDVRNTMFMCDFPKAHWAPLAPAMKHNAAVHSAIAGHVPRGPLKHYWGEAARYVSDDNPYSLWLSLGIPFEVTAEPAADGFTFLSDADAQDADRLAKSGAPLLARPREGLSRKVRPIAESFADLSAWKKKEVLPKLKNVPYVENETPVVCSWYPTARAVALWNLSEQRQEFQLRFGETRRTVGVDGLGIALVEGVGAEG